MKGREVGKKNNRQWEQEKWNKDPKMIWKGRGKKNKSGENIRL